MRISVIVMVIRIPFRGNRARVLRKIQEEALKQEILFEGTTASGKFEGQGIVGRYWFSQPQEITIVIDQKPPLITENRIKEIIQRYLEVF